jgi:hypothetical protein
LISVTVLKACGGSSSPNADARSIKASLARRHPREVELGLRDVTSALEGDCIIGVAGDFAGELVQLFGECRG